MNASDYLENLITQYIKNPIQIPSELFTVEIHDRKSIENLALNPKYFIKKGSFFIFNISNLLNLDSDLIDITIYSNFKLYLEKLITSQISRQPIVLGKNLIKYELTSILKTDQFPERFICLDVPINYELNLNDFIHYFVNKKFLYAEKKYIELETRGIMRSRKKSEYYKKIKNKYGVAPLMFHRKIQEILADILTYIQENYSKVIKIENLDGNITPKIPEAYHIAEKTGVLVIKFKFSSRFDQNNLRSHSYLIFKFNWMRRIFKKHLPEIRTY